MSHEEYVPEELIEHKDRAIVAVLNANRDSTEEEAEEMVNAIVNLVFEAMKFYLDEEMNDELTNH
jgi:succinate dehydrogenase flavin-adding protein (antitoxin of CptAB toxin-antitoxin module)